MLGDMDEDNADQNEKQSVQLSAKKDRKAALADSNSPQKSLETSLKNYLGTLQPDADVLELPVDETLEVYVALFNTLMERRSISDLHKALVAVNAYSKLHRCSIRDARRGHRDRTAVCDIAIKVLSWTWFRSNGLGKAEKEEAVDTLIEIFFSCEQNVSSKSLTSTAQMCVWGLSSISGRFPTESGRLRRALEVAALSNHNNVFGSDRVHCESCRLLKSMAVNNFDSVSSCCAELIVPVIHSLCHRGEKIHGLAYDALLAGMPACWNNLAEIDRKLNEDESTWLMIKSFFSSALEDPLGSSRRIHVANCFGSKFFYYDALYMHTNTKCIKIVVVLLFGRSLRTDLDKLNEMFGFADALLQNASTERHLLLKQWKFVIEAFAEDKSVLAYAKKLQLPMRTTLREGREPDAKVRREAFLTWTYLASALFHEYGLKPTPPNRDNVRDVIRTLHKAVGDYDAQVRGPAIKFAVELVRKLQQQIPPFPSNDFDEDEESDQLMRQRRAKIFESIMIPLVYEMPKSTPYPEMSDLCQLLDVTLKAFPDLEESRMLDLFLESVPLWISVLTTSKQSLRVANEVSRSLAERSLGTIRTLQNEYADALILALDQKLREGEDDLGLLVNPCQLVDAMIENYVKSTTMGENERRMTTMIKHPRPTVVACLARLLLGHSMDEFWKLKRPVECWVIFASWMILEPNASDFIDHVAWMGLVFQPLRIDIWSNLSVEMENIIVHLFQELLKRNPQGRFGLVDMISQMEPQVLNYENVSARALGLVIDQLGQEDEHDNLTRIVALGLGNVLRSCERIVLPERHRQVHSLLLENAGKIVQVCKSDSLANVFEALVQFPCEQLLLRIFPSVILTRMKSDFTWMRYGGVLEKALLCTDRSIRSMAMTFLQSQISSSSGLDSIPLNLKPFLQQQQSSSSARKDPPLPTTNNIIGQVAVVGNSPGITRFGTPLNSVQRQLLPRFSGEKNDVSDSAGGGAPRSATSSSVGSSSAKKRARISEAKDWSERGGIGVATYTNLDASQPVHPHEEEEEEGENGAIVGRAASSNQDPSAEIALDIRKLKEMIQMVDVRSMSMESFQSFRDESGELIRVLFDAVSRRCA